MRKFEFRLKSLQKAKLTQEKELKRDLAQIESRLEIQQRELLALEDAKASLTNQWQADMAKGLGAAAVRQFSISFDRLSELRDITIAEIDKIEAEKEACRQRLVALMSDLKGLETLENEQFESYLKETARESELEIGDFVSFRHKPAAPGRVI